jgi:uncharacterized protein YlaN (UPF0358 family)
MKYTEWDSKDPFIAIPFLPGHINIIPQYGQSVKIIQYDTDKDFQNVEYVSGPYTSPHDFESQSFTAQHQDTTYGGVIVEGLPDLKDKGGNYIDRKSYGTMADLNDTALNGNYGSDIVFTKNGMMLRGGKLINKDVPNPKFRQRLSEVPLLSEKMSRLGLKKFPRTMEVKDEKIKITKIPVAKINHLIEYSLDNLTTPTEIKINVYKILDTYGPVFDSNYFNESSYVDVTDTKKVKIYNDGTITGSTITVSVTSVQDAYIEMRELLYTLSEEGLSKFNTSYPKDDIHPFYFRPAEELKTRVTTNPTEISNRTKFINGIQVKGVGGVGLGSGLIFSKQFATPPTKNSEKTIKVLKAQNNKGEQTFANLVADKVYFVSTSTNKGPKKSIDFSKIDNYEYTQEDYLIEMEPCTYSTVRGEVLIQVIKTMYRFLVGHVHGWAAPGHMTTEDMSILKNLIDSMDNDLINNSIRIN